MKKTLKYSVVSLFVLLLCFMTYKIFNKIQYKTEVAQALSNIPEFSFETIDGDLLTNESLAKNKSTVFIYFNSECDYCKHEALSIQNNIEKFNNSQLIFISSETRKTIKDFALQYKLDTYDNVYFLFDLQDDFSNRFDATAIPYVLIYNKNQQLIKRHKGQLKVETILQLLETNIAQL